MPGSLTSLGSTSPLVQSLTITYGLAALPPAAPPAPPPPLVDTTPPIGATVAALRPFVRSLAPLKLAFSALDPETGVARYAVFLRVGKSGTTLPAATLWKSGLTTPGAVYTGAAGTTACFSVVATNGQASSRRTGKDSPRRRALSRARRSPTARARSRELVAETPSRPSSRTAAAWSSPRPTRRCSYARASRPSGSRFS